MLVRLSAFAPLRADARAAENRTWVFLPQSVETRLESEPQAAGTQRENGLWNYEHVPGCTQAAESRLSPTNYPNPDPAMSVPPVRYEPTSLAEVERMRKGLGPTTKATHGTGNIEAHTGNRCRYRKVALWTTSRSRRIVVRAITPVTVGRQSLRQPKEHKKSAITGSSAVRNT